MVATIGSWAIGTRHGDGDAVRRAGTSAVMVIAFAKVALVGEHFMGLRTAPVLLRAVFAAWVIGVCTTVVSIYLARG